MLRRHFAVRIWALAVMVLSIGTYAAFAQGNGNLPPGCTTSGMNQGANVIYSSLSGVVGSNGVIDASALGNGDVCTEISAALTALTTSCHPYAQGESVIDARGFATPQNCGINPFAQSAPTHATVLLPAGTINISVPWVLPARTRLIGEGAQVTILKAASGFSGDMIDMGQGGIQNFYCTQASGFANCNGIQVEHLGLDGSNYVVNGIVNNYGEELNYVNDVELDNLTGVALTIGFSSGLDSGNATNSGPYTNIASNNAGTCVKISGGNASGGYAGTRGIYGLTCTTTLVSSTSVAVNLDASNTTLENVMISGFHDGILVGQNYPAQNDTLKNIYGSGTGIAKLLHISTGQTSYGATGQPLASQLCPSPSLTNVAFNVCDLTVLVATSSAGSVITDDLTSDSIAASTNPTVAMYSLGEQQASGVYARVTTSSALPTWYSSNQVPPSTTGNGCKTGSLYSCSGTSCAINSKTTNLYACTNGTWYRVK